MKAAITRLRGSFANLRWILRPSLLILAIYQLTRIVFLLKYPQTRVASGLRDIFDFILAALRFDSSLFFSLFLLFFVMLVLPVRHRIWKVLIRAGFTATGGFFLVFEIIDIYFFGFNARRLDFPAFRFLVGDLYDQIPQFLVNYPLIPLGWLAVYILIWISFPVYPAPAKKSEANWWSGLFAALICTAAGIAFIRNSIGEKPLLPGQAFMLNPQAAGHAALNTGFVLLKTLSAYEMENSAFIPSGEAAALLKSCPPDSALLSGRNLVLIILESFASEYMGLESGAAGQTPFLDSLARAGTWFPHHYASGRTSRDALPSILASVPPWMDESFAGSRYVSADLEGLGTTLSDQGYTTSFFHGGKNGTMYFDVMSERCGFDTYFGMNEYPETGDFDGNWGIFDQPFLHFTAREISRMKQPFAACIFTLSSHQPYTLPTGWNDTSGTRGLPVYKAIRYSDDALRRFFRDASRMPWYRNTLFVLTADHTREIYSPQFQNHGGFFDVPLVFFAPGCKIPADTSVYIQHTDIRPMVLNYLGFKSRSHNSLSGDNPLCCPFPPMQYQDGMYSVIHPDGCLFWPGTDSTANWNWQSLSGKPEPAGLRRQSMARLQYYRNGLIDNKLFQKGGSK